MSSTSGRRLVVVVVGLFVVAGTWLSFLNPRGDSSGLIFGPVFFLVAAFLVLRVPGNRVSWVLLGISLGFGLGGFYREGVGWAETLSFSAFFVFVLPGLGVFLPAWFPTGFPPGRMWSWLSGTAYASAGLMAGSIVLGLISGDFDDDIVGCTSPSACLEFGAVLLTLVGSLLAVASLFFRFVKSDGTERQQMKLMALAFGLFLLGAGLEFGGLQGNPMAEFLFGVGTLAIPLALAVTISRYRLYDIDRIISRTVAYVILVAVLGLLFAVGVVMVPQAILGTGTAPPLLVAASTLLVAALFNPLRRRVQRWVDRRFNRSKYDAERVMDEFARSLRNQVDEAAVLHGLQGVVTETMRPTSVSVWVRP